MLIDSTGFPLTTIHYDKRLNDFGRKERKKCFKTKILVDDKSQIIVSYTVYFERSTIKRSSRRRWKKWTEK